MTSQEALNFYPDACPFWDSTAGQEALEEARRLGLKAQNTNRERCGLHASAMREAEFDVRNAKGENVKLVVGMWYVGMNWGVDGEGAGAIAQYVGDGEFYDEGCDEPTRMQDYEYIVESHMGRLS